MQPQQWAALASQVHAASGSGDVVRLEALVGENSQIRGGGSMPFLDALGVPIEGAGSLLHVVVAQCPSERRQEALEFLLDAGIEGDVVNSRNRLGETPLMLTVRSAIAADALADPAETPGGAARGSAAFLPDIVMLLKASGNPNVADTRMRETPLMEAAVAGNAAVCEVLLNYLADPHCLTAKSMTALDFAAKEHRRVRRLLEKTAVKDSHIRERLPAPGAPRQEAEPKANGGTARGVQRATASLAKGSAEEGATHEAKEAAEGGRIEEHEASRRAPSESAQRLAKVLEKDVHEYRKAPAQFVSRVEEAPKESAAEPARWPMANSEPKRRGAEHQHGSGPVTLAKAGERGAARIGPESKAEQQGFRSSPRGQAHQGIAARRVESDVADAALFDGHWMDEDGNIGTIRDCSMYRPLTNRLDVTMSSRDTLQLMMGPKNYTGFVSPNGARLFWSDGDTWIRVPEEDARQQWMRANQELAEHQWCANIAERDSLQCCRENCPYLVHSRRVFGSYCCVQCWEDGSHGRRCERKVAPPSTQRSDYTDIDFADLSDEGSPREPSPCEWDAALGERSEMERID